MKLIIGCGYLGLRVARRWLADEQPVAALTRTAARADELRAEGILPILGDVTQAETLAKLAEVVSPGDTVLYAVGYDRSAGHAMETVYVDGLRAVLDALPPTVGRIIYISSTGVYGQVDGETIDESSPTEPRREGGRVCLAAERALQAHPLGADSIVLRLSGIYGPGRVPNRADLAAGKPLPFDPTGHLNLIHVDDAATAVLTAEARATLPNVFVVSDGHPPTRGEYYGELARLWNTPAPNFAPPEANAAPVRRGGADKRISPAKLLRELDIRFGFPDYRAGLADISRRMGIDS